MLRAADVCCTVTINLCCIGGFLELSLLHMGCHGSRQAAPSAALSGGGHGGGGVFDCLCVQRMCRADVGR